MPVGRTRDVGWEIGVSRTLDAPARRVWDLLTVEPGPSLWLGAGLALPATPGTGYRLVDGTVGEVRSFRPLDRIRLTFAPPGREAPTTVQVAIVAKGDRTMVRFHQERLADADERARQRTHWSGVLDRIEAALAARSD